MNTLEKIVAFMQSEMQKPTLFGGAHLFWLALTVLGIVAICLTCKKLSDKKFRMILLIVGASLLTLEVFKQLNFAYDAETDVWDYYWKQFPFQFCSVPMYVMVAVACLKEGKVRDCLCAFLATFGLFAGMIVMVYPATVLSEIIFRFSQSMAHHSAMLIVGVLMFVSGKVKIEHKTILKALPVFATCVVLAFTMNIIHHASGNTDSFNMFYIGPYDDCDIPILDKIGEALKIESEKLHIGNFAFVFIYIVGFSIAAYVILLFAMLISFVSRKIRQKLAK